jgi:tetratricopeptide (TPR) repeat protein
LQTIKEQDKGESYYYALIEFGRAVLNINAEGGQAKAAKALVEAVDGTRAAQGEYSELHALALLALGEAKKAAEDYDGCIELIEKALTTKKLPPLDHSRALCFLGSAYSEKPGQAQKSLECYLEAIALRTTLCANGAENMMVAEVYLDVAAEHYELGQQLKTVEALEKCIPFLSLPDHVVDVQFAWLRKALEAAQLSEDEAQERYRRIKQTRKTAQAAKRRLAGPVKDKAAVANSFLPAVKLPPKKKQQGGKKK